MNLADLSSAQLKRAVQIKEQIESLQSQLSTLFGETGRSSAPSRPAQVSGKQSVQSQSKKPAAKKSMSAAARAKISAAAKARWAKAKAAGKKSL